MSARGPRPFSYWFAWYGVLVTASLCALAIALDEWLLGAWAAIGGAFWQWAAVKLREVDRPIARIAQDVAGRELDGDRCTCAWCGREQSSDREYCEACGVVFAWHWRADDARRN